jgi:WD40 repeat protein
VAEWSIHSLRTALRSIDVAGACGVPGNSGGNSSIDSSGVGAAVPWAGGAGTGSGVVGVRMSLDPNGHGLVLSSRTNAAALVCLAPPSGGGGGGGAGDGGGGGGGGAGGAGGGAGSGDGAGGGAVHALPAHGGEVTCVDWHPTRSVVLTGSADHSLQLTHIALKPPP